MKNERDCVDTFLLSRGKKMQRVALTAECVNGVIRNGGLENHAKQGGQLEVVGQVNLLNQFQDILIPINVVDKFSND